MKSNEKITLMTSSNQNGSRLDLMTWSTMSQVINKDTRGLHYQPHQVGGIMSLEQVGEMVNVGDQIRKTGGNKEAFTTADGLITSLEIDLITNLAMTKVGQMRPRGSWLHPPDQNDVPTTKELLKKYVYELRIPQL